MSMANGGDNMPPHHNNGTADSLRKLARNEVFTALSRIALTFFSLFGPVVISGLVYWMVTTTGWIVTTMTANTKLIAAVAQAAALNKQQIDTAVNNLESNVTQLRSAIKDHEGRIRGLERNSFR